MVIGTAEDAKGCHWTGMDTTATLRPDGSMHVVEGEYYDFHGECHGGIRFLNAAAPHVTDTLGSTQYTLSTPSVTEDGEKVPSAESRPGYVKWGSAKKTVSGEHVYEVSYDVTHAVHLAADTAVLYWQFLGTDAPRMDVFVTLHTKAASGDDLQGWGHGVLEGELATTAPTCNSQSNTTGHTTPSNSGCWNRWPRSPECRTASR
ncbi:MAG: DUF2207 domain-containing protein [Jatrophihabitans sp.]